MKTLYTNATVGWNEFEIARRETFIREIPLLLLGAWQNLNKAVRMERCETPILTPEEYLGGHIAAGFELLKTESRGYLRPETTAGTYEYMRTRFNENALQKNLPFCLWQAGISFRDEKNAETMRASKLRLVQFYQMEFQLFCSPGTLADYLGAAAEVLESYIAGEQSKIISVFEDELPHYSEETLDWMIDGLEVASLSRRNDWPGGVVFEVAIGLDRLVALTAAQ